MLAVAGLMIRLVQRLEVRHEPTRPSPAAASVAAAGPCRSRSRKMTTSPAVNECFERGTRKGKKPASTGDRRGRADFGQIAQRQRRQRVQGVGENRRADQRRDPPIGDQLPVVVRHQGAVQATPPDSRLGACVASELSCRRHSP
jgi:hypothetical protein